MILVNGTATDSLKKGPGRDLETYMPGEGQLVYIAGHRTTYLAPFSHIDHLRAGDVVTLSMPYGTFIYRITHHIIVSSDDLSVLRSTGQEIVALQACHPRFFATHRYIAYARLVRFELPGGRALLAGVAVRSRGTRPDRPEPARRGPAGRARARIGSGGADDHVRLLALQRIERHCGSLAPRAGADAVVAGGVGAQPGAEDPGQVARCRVGVPLQREQRRSNEQLEPDERRHRVPGQAEDERAPEDAERDRLAGTHGDAPEDLLHAQLGLDPAHQVVGADRDAARGDEDVGGEGPARSPPECASSLSTTGAQALHLGPGQAELRGEGEGCSTRRSRPAPASRRGRGAPVPVASTTARGRQAQTTDTTPAAARAPSWAGPRRTPAGSTASPAPARRRHGAARSPRARPGRR